MGAKEEIARLEQKIDVLYNVVWLLMNANGMYEQAEHFRENICQYMDVVNLESKYLYKLGKN